MSIRFQESIRCSGWLVLANVLITLNGCSISFDHDPAKTVTVEITAINDESDRDEVQEMLQGMTDGSSHMMTSTSSGAKMTVTLSPVSDVKAFSRKINFGDVSEVDGRTVKVDFVK